MTTTFRKTTSTWRRGAPSTGRVGVALAGTAAAAFSLIGSRWGSHLGLNPLFVTDLLIALGTRFDDRVTGDLSTFAPEAKVVHADVDPAEIGKNRVADVPIVGDAREVITELTAALRNAARVLDRDLAALKVVVSGAGASGVACAKILLSAGASDVVVLDSRGVIHAGRDGMNVEKMALAEETNPRGVRGDLAAAVSGADVFLGLSGSTIPESVIASMAEGGIVFALSNPDPEIDPEVARKHAAVVATGRSDYPNQINNVLAFPGVFAGALDAAARRITEAMKLAAAEAIADIAAGDEEFGADHIVPSALDPRVAPAVAQAVARAAAEEGVVRRHVAEVAAEGHGH